jgi:hypothetical protein
MAGCAHLSLCVDSMLSNAVIPVNKHFDVSAYRVAEVKVGAFSYSSLDVYVCVRLRACGWVTDAAVAAAQSR